MAHLTQPDLRVSHVHRRVVRGFCCSKSVQEAGADKVWDNSGCLNLTWPVQTSIIYHKIEEAESWRYKVAELPEFLSALTAHQSPVVSLCFYFDKSAQSTTVVMHGAHFHCRREKPMWTWPVSKVRCSFRLSLGGCFCVRAGATQHQQLLSRTMHHWIRPPEMYYRHFSDISYFFKWYMKILLTSCCWNCSRDNICNYFCYFYISSFIINGDREERLCFTATIPLPLTQQATIKKSQRSGIHTIISQRLYNWSIRPGINLFHHSFVLSESRPWNKKYKHARISKTSGNRSHLVLVSCERVISFSRSC